MRLSPTARSLGDTAVRGEEHCPMRVGRFVSYNASLLLRWGPSEAQPWASLWCLQPEALGDAIFREELQEEPINLLLRDHLATIYCDEDQDGQADPCQFLDNLEVPHFTEAQRQGLDEELQLEEL
ncbi:hypothetical protein NDU88_005045 [Pleurodeles waltl]|uniref:Uncharacterized protein n=1 Tax=Pleurodeles waltl TaxID=8319 RepID=A0AAV7VJX7_PLEWA|nr:hypothetical protein NDU88_005045 [Pleurodeles waltl]